MHPPTTVGSILLLFLGAALAHSRGPESTTCNNFNVAHGDRDVEDDSHVVSLYLMQTNSTGAKERVDCFWPTGEYDLVLSSDTVIKGFILQAVSGSRLPSHSGRNDIPVGTAPGPCESNTVSHSKLLKSTDLVFPITTKKSMRPLVFRYTVVFSMFAAQQNRFEEIPCCHDIHYNHTDQVPTEIVTESPEPTKSPSEPTVPTEDPQITYAEPLGNITVDENCGRDVINKEVQYNDTHAGLRYNCTINKPLKQTSCIPTCTISQTPVVCQVHKNIRRRKGFTCVLYRDGDQADPFETPVEYSYSAIFEEMVTSGCQCYVENS